MADDRWSVAVLDRMRREGDPLADSTVKAVFDKGTVAAVNELLTKLVRNDDIPAGPWPPELTDYLRASAQLPGWADAALIRTGENVFLRYGLTSFGILACASFPECYVLQDVTAVLGTTQRLDARARRRVFETSMMVLAVMAEGGLEPGGSGIRIVQKVRLMHVAVRYLILTPSPAAAAGPPSSRADTLLAQRWPAERGTPLSQEDLAAVLLTFSYVMVRSWKHLGITLSPRRRARTCTPGTSLATCSAFATSCSCPTSRRLRVCSTRSSAGAPPTRPMAARSPRRSSACVRVSRVPRESCFVRSRAS
jgi:hypothetical protein